LKFSRLITDEAIAPYAQRFRSGRPQWSKIYSPPGNDIYLPRHTKIFLQGPE